VAAPVILFIIFSNFFIFSVLLKEVLSNLYRLKRLNNILFFIFKDLEYRCIIFINKTFDKKNYNLKILFSYKNKNIII